MHKNQQYSVDSISDILLHGGMNARKMKKLILFYALDMFSTQTDDDDIAMVLDIFTTELTPATRNRFRKVTRQMLDDALSKLD